MTTTNTQSNAFVDAAKMRREFDQQFAAPEPSPASASEDFLAGRVGGRPFAMRVAELAWVELHRKVVALPSAQPSLLGLISARGQLVPVYSLELVLGLPATPTTKSWVAIYGRQTPLGLAFDTLGGYFRILQTEILGENNADSNSIHARQAVRWSGEVWPIIHLPSILATIRESVSPQGPTQETEEAV